MLPTFPQTPNLRSKIQNLKSTRGARPRNTNALRHGLYSTYHPSPFSTCSASVPASPSGVLPTLYDQAIQDLRLTLARYLDTRPPLTDDAAQIAWHKPIIKAVSTIQRLQRLFAPARFASSQLTLAAAHPLELVRWGFHHDHIDRDIDLPPSGADGSQDTSDTSDTSAISNISFLTADQWSTIAPLLPRSASKRGRPPSDPRPLLDAILWRLALHTRWSDLAGPLRAGTLPKFTGSASLGGTGASVDREAFRYVLQQQGRGRAQPEISHQQSSISRLTVRRYYRRLYTSGRLYIILQALFRHFERNSRLSLSSLAAAAALSPDRRVMVLSSTLPHSWQARTALLFLQLAYQNLRRLRQETPRLPRLPFKLALRLAAVPTHTTSPQASDQGLSFRHPRSRSSFRAKNDESDYNSPADRPPGPPGPHSSSSTSPLLKGLARS